MTASTRTSAGHRGRRIATAGVLALAAFGGATVSSPVMPSVAAPPPSEGIVCTNPSNSSAGHKNYVLTAREGVIQMPDGNSVWMWSYAAGNGAFQYPGPVLCPTAGDVVTVTLRNQLPVRTSAQFYGIDGVQANGIAALPQFDGTVLRSLTSDVAPGGSITYSFAAPKPGTYLYQSGNDPELQVEMGLVGAMIVSPLGLPDPVVVAGLPPAEAGFARLAYDDQATMYSAEHEYLLMLTELDPDLHYAVEEGLVLSSEDYTGTYHPRYFMLNGRSFPDTVAPNGAAWLPNQPYGAMAHVEPYDAVTNPLPALIRYLAVGGESYPFHPHSNHEKVIAKDGRRLLDGPAGAEVDLAAERFAIVVEPGSTVDALFTWEHVEDPYTQANPIPVPAPEGNNLTEGDLYSGSPYLGAQGNLNPETQGKNVCGEYYHVAHNHNLSEATNYGAAFGGHFTLIRVDPADSTNCGNS